MRCLHYKKTLKYKQFNSLGYLIKRLVIAHLMLVTYPRLSDAFSKVCEGLTMSGSTSLRIQVGTGYTKNESD